MNGPFTSRLARPGAGKKVQVRTRTTITGKISFFPSYAYSPIQFMLRIDAINHSEIKAGRHCTSRTFYDSL